MRLSIVTINFNGSDSTIRLLRSLQEQTDRDFSTIVIDNASEEADFNNLQELINKGILSDKMPLLIRNKENLGFSGGNNVGIREALKRGSDPVKSPNGDNGASWVVLINNDVWVESRFISVLRAKLSQSGGIVGIPLVENEHTAYCGKVEWLKPTLRHIYNPLYAEQLRRHVNYYAIGGAMAIHRSVFDKIGFLDEKYFLYFEDADVSVRARKAGISIGFIDEPKVHHQVSGTTKRLGSPLLLRYHYRNALYFNFKNGPRHIKFLLWLWSFWVIVKQLSKILFMYKQKQSVAILSGVLDFYRNKMGKIK